MSSWEPLRIPKVSFAGLQSTQGFLNQFLTFLYFEYVTGLPLLLIMRRQLEYRNVLLDYQQSTYRFSDQCAEFPGFRSLLGTFP